MFDFIQDIILQLTKNKNLRLEVTEYNVRDKKLERLFDEDMAIVERIESEMNLSRTKRACYKLKGYQDEEDWYYTEKYVEVLPCEPLHYKSTNEKGETVFTIVVSKAHTLRYLDIIVSS